MDKSELVAAVRQLRTYGRADRPARHQPILLLWALGRARRGAPRLVRWSDARPELTELLTTYGLPESAATPEYPFVALAHTDWWELDDVQGEVPAAHGSAVLRWLNAVNPSGGLTSSVYNLLAADDTARADVVGGLLNRYFRGDRCDDLLRSVGLYSAGTGAPRSWDLQVGDVVRRQAIHERFGGQKQGGISTPANNKMVFLFTDSTGTRYGYDYDGWKSDGSYHYTGHGRAGDQLWTASNRAVLDPGREIHVFAEAARTVVRYVGQFTPDTDEPYYRADALDVETQPRSVIVFRLWPTDGAPEPVGATQVPEQTRSVDIPLEAHNVAEFESNPPSGPRIVKRLEAALVQRYSAWLHKRGVSTGRNAIEFAGQPKPFFTDLFDHHARELVEAKGGATRDHVRLALGQLFDYARYVQADALAVLLPVRPAEDLVDLLIAHGVSCIYEMPPNSFERVDAAPS